MSVRIVTARFERTVTVARERARNLRGAVTELLSQEFAFSTGHLTALLGGCVFAPSLLTFWLVNGVLDFSTAVLIGSIATPVGLVVRLIAYVLLVPAFLLLRITYYLAHPVHREAVLSGSCPTADLLSLDWFSVGILATGLPLAFQHLGPWLGSNSIYLLGLFVLPRFVRSDRRALTVKVGAIVVGTLVFLYANYGGLLAATLPAIPAPDATLGPVATLTLSDATTGALVDLTNSYLTGPIVVAAVAVGMNYLLTRPELTSIPVVRHSLPRRDPIRIVAASAALGTLFYLTVVALLVGEVGLVPDVAALV